MAPDASILGEFDKVHSGKIDIIQDFSFNNYDLAVSALV